MKFRQNQINKLAKDIMNEINGLLEGEEPELTIFKKENKIAKLSEKGDK